jgi:aspartyl-tRNA synthetase
MEAKMAESLSGWRRSIYCGELRATHAGQAHTLMGWVHRRRDLGNLIFLTLRDREGLAQVVFNPELDPALHEKAKAVRPEFVLAIRGRVDRRPAGQENKEMPTGAIEVVAQELKILNEAQTPPIQIDDVAADTSEDVRLKWRFLDLRRPALQRVLFVRHRSYQVVREYLSRHGFIEVETPVLSKSTPEGARDYLVPSRIHPGRFFALPQSPQLYKQLLMVSGFDRYFQIVKCFRDEDLRADRQPEFTQIDIETSFLEQNELLTIVEGLMAELLGKMIGAEAKLPLDRVPYAEAMARWGSDKPDRRFAMELVDLSAEVKGSEFSVFKNALAAGGAVRAIVSSGQHSRKQSDELGEFVKVYGAKGLVHLKVAGQTLTGGAAKFLTPEDQQTVIAKCAAKDGDSIFVVADKEKVVFDALGALRLRLGREQGLIDQKKHDLFYVVDFPLLEWNEEDQRYYAMHHPFTSPKEEDVALLAESPGKVRANAYDMVWNGNEIGGGSIRIHRAEVQSRMFRALGIGDAEAREKFGFLLDALSYGTPPHGGIAFGLDRIIMLLTGAPSIRDVIAFPKTAKAACLMTDSPSAVAESQLADLHIKVRE